jgi:hypothetical protein
MRSDKVILDPCNEVILERSFNHLVEKIRRKELMNVRSGEVIGERLPKKKVSTRGMTRQQLMGQISAL